MPPSASKSVSNFTLNVEGRFECNFCKHSVGKLKNSTRLKEHLMKCPKTPLIVKQLARSETRSADITESTQLPDVAPTPNLWTADNQARAILLLTIWLTKDGMAISTVESAALAAFLAYLNPNFTLPDRSTVMDRAEQLAAKKKEEMKKEISQSQTLTLISDGWSNIRSEYITNYIIHTTETVLFWGSRAWQDEKHSAENIAADLIKIIEELNPLNVLYNYRVLKF
jgi:hypothetical protein